MALDILIPVIWEKKNLIKLGNFSEEDILECILKAFDKKKQIIVRKIKKKFDDHAKQYKAEIEYRKNQKLLRKKAEKAKPIRLQKIKIEKEKRLNQKRAKIIKKELLLNSLSPEQKKLLKAAYGK